MQAMQSLTGSCGLPLCISGITRSIPFAKQMVDHDRRRKAVMRRTRSRSRSGSGSHDEDGASAAASSRRRRETEGGGEDLSGLTWEGITKPCTAKAA